jgi:hypothetical protein
MASLARGLSECDVCLAAAGSSSSVGTLLRLLCSRQLLRWSSVCSQLCRRWSSTHCPWSAG